MVNSFFLNSCFFFIHINALPPQSNSRCQLMGRDRQGYWQVLTIGLRQIISEQLDERKETFKQQHFYRCCCCSISWFMQTEVSDRSSTCCLRHTILPLTIWKEHPLALFIKLHIYMYLAFVIHSKQLSGKTLAGKLLILCNHRIHGSKSRKQALPCFRQGKADRILFSRKGL